LSMSSPSKLIKPSSNILASQFALIKGIFLAISSAWRIRERLSNS
jgi:hypothetical protein